MFGNTFGATSKIYGNNTVNVWHEVKASYPVGGTLDVSAIAQGTILKAGSFYALDMTNHAIIAKPSAYAASAAYAKGDYVENNGSYYKCKTAVASSTTWATDGASFDEVHLAFGLLLNDIVVDAAAKSASGAVTATLVYEGEIYASRTSLTASQLALVPHVTPIYEN